MISSKPKPASSAGRAAAPAAQDQLVPPRKDWQQPRQLRASRLWHQLVPPSKMVAAGAATDDSTSRKKCKGSYCTSSLPFNFAHISSSQFSGAGRSHLFNPQGQASLPQSFVQPSSSPSVPSANVQPSSAPSASQPPPPTVNRSPFLLLVFPTCHYPHFVLYAQLCIL